MGLRFVTAKLVWISSRLRRLEKLGVLERRMYFEHPPRYEYHLTEAGADLRPIVLALKEWGDTHVTPGQEPVVFEHNGGAEFHPLTVCARLAGRRSAPES